MAKNPAAFAQMDASSLGNVVKILNSIVDATALSIADKQKLISLMQSQQESDADDDELGAPEAAVYKSHSTGILDVLEDLKEKSEEQLSDLRKAETNAKHNFAMLKQSLEDQIAADTKSLNDEKAAKSAAEEAKATAEGDLAQTVKDLADAEAALADTQSSKEQITADHEATVKGRTEELAAIGQAKKVLVESTSGAVGQAYSMLQVQRSQTGSRMQTRADLAGAEIVNIVKRLAQKHHSTALEQLASRIATTLRMGATAGEDPFAKVKDLINGLITKLEAEAGSEATEKAYCDEQIKKTEEKKSELDDDISKLTAKIDVAVAKSAGLKEDVKELQAERSS